MLKFPSGFWYTAAIATTAGALFSVVTTLNSNSPSRLTGRSHQAAEASGTAGKDCLPAVPESVRAITNALSNASEDLTAKDVPTEDVPESYTRAVELANQAVLAYQAAQAEPDAAQKQRLTERERFLWQATLQKLSEISNDEAVYSDVQARRTHYRTLLANAESKLDSDENDFLGRIIQAAQAPLNDTHVTLCQIDINDATNLVSYSRQGTNNPTLSTTAQLSSQRPYMVRDRIDTERCRHYQGDTLLASPASLIKLPIAIALLDKAATDGINLNDKIYIDPHNFTENAAGASIDIGEEYSLEQVMARMINQSNNIATNQLIDYVGRDRIAQTMAARGYVSTLVDFKLAGDQILPPDPGTVSNQSTTHDLTVMMAHTYSLKNPGDEALLRALISQKDQELGYQALQNLSPAIEWMGEKTGQNDKLIGSTLVMKVGAERYALTVAIDHSGDPYAIRDIIRGAANHLLETGPLVGGQERSQ
ncbi:MAG: serine hydrolase [Cyanobacteria bacterium J06607_10]